MEDLRAHFRPEFLNRLDEIIMFKPLTKDNIENIIGIMIDNLNHRIEDKELHIEVSSSAKDYIVDQGLRPGLRRKTAEALFAETCGDTCGTYDPCGSGQSRRCDYH